jgi:hypothetical protein
MLVIRSWDSLLCPPEAVQTDYALVNARDGANCRRVTRILNQLFILQPVKNPAKSIGCLSPHSVVPALLKSLVH